MYRNDRRMFDRFEVDFSAEIQQPGQQERICAQCCDISAAGAGFHTQQRLIANTNLKLWLSIPDGRPPFSGTTRVIWSKQVQEDKWRSGLAFETIDFIGLRRIFASLAQRL